jgi:hypothetical protein
MSDWIVEASNIEQKSARSGTETNGAVLGRLIDHAFRAFNSWRQASGRPMLNSSLAAKSSASG